MIINVDYKRTGFIENYKIVQVELKLYTDDSVLSQTTVDAELIGSFTINAQIPRTKLFLDISCNDQNIFHSHLAITEIHFDKFFHLRSIIHNAYRISSDGSRDVDQGNCLYFAGKLQYIWQGPLVQMIIPSPGKFCHPI